MDVSLVLSIFFGCAEKAESLIRRSRVTMGFSGDRLQDGAE
ncbi:hypothetical protein Rhow_004541 [Rhodococcus wratislaviensis]|uniref:Uncharacterized protein n=1 Tax=Rhodococcus wratislaviensis TaxID=44752 RepID=A0A402CBD0_RHOWR|nr:hypothetical protein Rhow_004541 [Rhodococcus wratislaviensis]